MTNILEFDKKLITFTITYIINYIPNYGFECKAFSLSIYTHHESKWEPKKLALMKSKSLLAILDGSIRAKRFGQARIASQASFNIDGHCETAVSETRILYINERRKISENYDHGSRRSGRSGLVNRAHVAAGQNLLGYWWLVKFMEALGTGAGGYFQNQAVALSRNLAANIYDAPLESHSRKIERRTPRTSRGRRSLLKPIGQCEGEGKGEKGRERAFLQ